MQELKYSPILGYLYNGNIVKDVRNIANVNSHVPTKEDFDNLISCCGGNESLAGDKLRTIGDLYWFNNPNGTDELGFHAVASGFKFFSGEFDPIDNLGGWVSFWSVTPDPDSDPVPRLNLFTFNIVGGESSLGNDPDNNGLSIRLVIDGNHGLTNGQTGTYIGNDGKKYGTICIGNLVWLSENLRETKWRNGTVIDHFDTNLDWANNESEGLPGYCSWQNGEIAYVPDVTKDIVFSNPLFENQGAGNFRFGIDLEYYVDLMNLSYTNSIEFQDNNCNTLGSITIPKGKLLNKTNYHVDFAYNENLDLSLITSIFHYRATDHPGMQLTVSLGYETGLNPDGTVIQRPNDPFCLKFHPTLEDPFGRIVVAMPTGEQYTYSLDGGEKQVSPEFNNVTPGDHYVTAWIGDNGSNPVLCTIHEIPLAPIRTIEYVSHEFTSDSLKVRYRVRIRLEEGQQGEYALLSPYVGFSSRVDESLGTLTAYEKNLLFEAEREIDSVQELVFPFDKDLDYYIRVKPMVYIYLIGDSCDGAFYGIEKRFVPENAFVTPGMVQKSSGNYYSISDRMTKKEFLEIVQHLDFEVKDAHLHVYQGVESLSDKGILGIKTGLLVANDQTDGATPAVAEFRLNGRTIINVKGQNVQITNIVFDEVLVTGGILTVTVFETIKY